MMATKFMNHFFNLATLLVITQYAHAQDPITMRRTFANDLVEKFNVKIEQTMSIESEGEKFESALALASKRSFTYTKLDKDGNASFEFVSNDFSGTETSEGETDKVANPEFYEQTYTAKVNPFMQLTDVAMKKAPSDDEEEDSVDPISDVLELGDMSFYYYNLPTKAVSTGDEWTIPLKSNKLYKPGQSVKVKFLGAQKWEDQDVLAIEYRTSADVDANLDEYDNGKPAFSDVTGAKLTATVEDVATVFLNPKDYSILFCTDKGKIKLQFKSSDGDLGIEIKFDEEMRRAK